MKRMYKTDRINLCNDHAKGALFLVTGFNWKEYLLNNDSVLGWYTRCDYGRNALGTICNAPAAYLYQGRVQT